MRLTATIRVEIVADTPEASDFLLKTVTRNVGSGHLMAYLKGADGSQRAARIERALTSVLERRDRVTGDLGGGADGGAAIGGADSGGDGGGGE
jgi:uncharacterized protein (UPF0261 family)